MGTRLQIVITQRSLTSIKSLIETMNSHFAAAQSSSSVINVHFECICWLFCVCIWTSSFKIWLIFVWTLVTLVGVVESKRQFRSCLLPIVIYWMNINGKRFKKNRTHTPFYCFHTAQIDVCEVCDKTESMKNWSKFDEMAITAVNRQFSPADWFRINKTLRWNSLNILLVS